MAGERTIGNSNRQWAQRIIFFILIVVWGFIITSFSAQTGEESAGLSEKVTEIWVEVAYSDYDMLPPTEKMNIFDIWHYIVRKTAHFTEYAIFSMLICGFLLSFSRLRPGNARFSFSFAVIATFFSAAFAAMDEYHQSFVDGRGPSVKDVLIDSGGAALGACAVLLVYMLVRRRRAKGRG